MKYTVVGVADGMRLEMPVEASNVVDAIHAAEAAGLVVTHVTEVIGHGFVGHAPGWGRLSDPPPMRIDGPLSGPPPMPNANKGDSPVLCAFVGLVIPIVGFLMALLKARKDPTGALACLIGSVVGIVLWGGVFA